VSEEKFSKCEEKKKRGGGKENYKCRISGVRKKKESSEEKKNQSVLEEI